MEPFTHAAMAPKAGSPHLVSWQPKPLPPSSTASARLAFTRSQTKKLSLQRQLRSEAMMEFRFIQGDVFEADLPRRHFALVYADPPYAGCRFKYARQNGSRQWGRNARADFMRELVARCEQLRAPDGIAAISMASPELRLRPLFPSNHRVFPWCKPFAPHRPHVWPTYAWEPVVAWGKFPGRAEQLASRTPHDWLQ